MECVNHIQSTLNIKVIKQEQTVHSLYKELGTDAAPASQLTVTL